MKGEKGAAEGRWGDEGAQKEREEEERGGGRGG